MQKTGLFAKLGVAAAVTMGGLALVSQPAAFAAAAPAFSVTPATGLSDGASVTASATGAAAGEQITILQCATVKDQLACNPATVKTVAADAAGSASTSFVVNKGFQAVTPDGTAVGSVDCAVTACYVSAGSPNGLLGSTQLSFR
ncbi:enediyne antibiotic chromoprotein [Streptosporangium sp. NPDC048047]|uniref:enediyne antibiotic chromoprotein n=1 Tax=Streptosporangium sp. NPDC048047 TaxID=3155748 RepID=UPI003419F93A